MTDSGKLVMSRIEVSDLIRPTTQMAPLVIEEHVPAFSGEHAVIASRDSLQVPIIDLRASGLVAIADPNDTTAPLALSEDEIAVINAIAAVNEAALASVVVEDGLHEAAPVAIEDAATDATVKSRPATTSLGVAPVETTVRTPYVRGSAIKIQEPQAHPIQPEAHERTAMVPLDPNTGMQRGGPWQAIVAVARSLRSVRWWRRRRTTDQVRRVEP